MSGVFQETQLVSFDKYIPTFFDTRNNVKVFTTADCFQLSGQFTTTWAVLISSHLFLSSVHQRVQNRHSFYFPFRLRCWPMHFLPVCSLIILHSQVSSSCFIFWMKFPVKCVVCFFPFTSCTLQFFLSGTLSLCFSFNFLRRKMLSMQPFPISERVLLFGRLGASPVFPGKSDVYMKMIAEHWWNNADRGKLKYYDKRRVPVSLFPPEMSYSLSRDRSRTSAVRGRWLTT